MRGEMIITEADYASRFQGERDLITCSPYCVGDRIVRCGTCRAIIKSEFVTEAGCPLCGSTPFVPATVIPPQRAVPSGYARSLRSFLWLLLLSAALAYLPFVLPGAERSLKVLFLGMESWGRQVYVGLVGLAAAGVLYFRRDARRMWQRSKWGGLLALGPMLAPYILLGAVWIAVYALALAAGIACIALAIGLILCLFE